MKEDWIDVRAWVTVRALLGQGLVTSRIRRGFFQGGRGEGGEGQLSKEKSHCFQVKSKHDPYVSHTNLWGLVDNTLDT